MNPDHLAWLQSLLRGYEARRDEANERCCFALDPVAPPSLQQASATHDPDWLSTLRDQLDTFLFTPAEADSLVRAWWAALIGHTVRAWQITSPSPSDEAYRIDWLIRIDSDFYLLHFGLTDVPT